MTLSHASSSSPVAATGRRDPIVTALYGIFLLSGAAGLMYESIWTRYLGLFVGHSAYAQVIVLVIFLGGMSLGSFWIGRRTLTIRRPLLWYAVVELCTGVIGLLFHDLFVATTNVIYAHVFPGLGLGVLHTVVKWTVSAALILPQSILLGMTFPLMSAGVVRRARGGAGRALSMLYFTNSGGAAIGVLVAGFVLVGFVGLPGTLVTAAIINLVVALAVMGLERLPAAGSATASPSLDAQSSTMEWTRDRRWVLLIGTSFATALSSFMYEIGWIRMLSLVLGSATHSFELMLSAFILGLALGAWWISRRADAMRSMRTLAMVQLAMGALAIATLPVYLASFGWMASFMAAFARTSQGYIGYSLARYSICLAVMLPATVCAGMTLPLITNALMRESAGERAIGQVYAINTLGSIVGAGLAAIVLLPLLGVKWLLVTGGLIDLAVGVLLFVEYAGRQQLFTPRRMVVVSAVIAALVLIVARSSFDHTVLSSGVYRYGTVQAPGTRNVIFYRDGRTATVSVRKQPSGALTLSTNGKPDGSLGSEFLSPRAAPAEPLGPLAFDAPTQLFTPLIPLAYAPNARTAVVIGQGTGMTTHALLGSPNLTQVVTVEIEPEMVRASRLFLPANRRAFEDPRSRYVIDDARSFLAADPRHFDLIISEPSNPWVSGVSGLFTEEFYERARQHLAPDGVFAQWLQLYEIDDRLVLTVLAALNRQFPSWAVYEISNRDVIIVASQTVLRDPDWSVLRFPGIASDLAVTWPITANTMDRMRLGDRALFAPLLDRITVSNSDYYPTLDMNAEKTRYVRAAASGLSGLNAGPVNIGAIVAGRRAGIGDPYAVIPGIPRIEDMAVNAARITGDRRGGPATTAAAERVRAFQESIAGGSWPVDWRVWVRNFADVSALIHGGMTGVADRSFFAAVQRYVDRAVAPIQARASVAFVRGMAEWNFGEAAIASDVLVASARQGDLWLDPDMLRDGAVLAKLKVGDVVGARDAYVILAPASARDSTDLRSQLLRAYILDARQRAATPPQTPR